MKIKFLVVFGILVSIPAFSAPERIRLPNPPTGYVYSDRIDATQWQSSNNGALVAPETCRLRNTEGASFLTTIRSLSAEIQEHKRSGVPWNPIEKLLLSVVVPCRVVTCPTWSAIITRMLYRMNHNMDVRKDFYESAKDYLSFQRLTHPDVFISLRGKSVDEIAEVARRLNGATSNDPDLYLRIEETVGQYGHNLTLRDLLAQTYTRDTGLPFDQADPDSVDAVKKIDQLLSGENLPEDSSGEPDSSQSAAAAAALH